MSAQNEQKHLLVIGAGPIGLDAALAATQLEYRVTVLEQGRVGEHLRHWSHVRLFTPWSINLSDRAREALRATGTWTEPEASACPTGGEMVENYLEPLAAVPELRDRIETGVHVVAIARDGLLKGEAILGAGDSRRVDRSFEVLVETAEGEERTISADVVIDATGVFSNPNPVGRGGIPARGERGHAYRLVYGVPDVAGSMRDRFEGRRTVVVGAGASAATTVRALNQLKGAEVWWVTRSEGEPIKPIDDDPLPERAALIAEVNAVGKGENSVIHLAGSSVTDLSFDGNEWTVSLAQTEGGAKDIACDEVVVQTGFRPDHSFAEELQFHECYASQGPMRLAGALLASSSGVGGGDCMKQESHGAESLLNPEPNYFVIGHKSYGRGSNFLLRIGYEQVSDVFSLLHSNTEVLP